MPKASLIDFIVDYYPEKETLQDLARKIIKSLFVNRKRGKKMTFCVVTGDSREGKSWTVLTIADIILNEEGLDFVDHVNDTVIYTPLEYQQKMNAILYEKRLKKLYVAIMDEARELVKAKKWQSIINQVIADVNAMAGRIKILVFFVVTQAFSDIDKTSRHTITYYATCYRPLKQRVKFEIFKVYKDDRDLENVKLKKRRIYGFVRVHKPGKPVKTIFYMPSAFRFAVPRKAITDIYEPENLEKKGKIIREKLDRMLKELENEFKDSYSKVNSMVEWYIDHPDQLNLFIKRSRGKISIKPGFKKMHDLSNEEAREFKERLLEKLTSRGLADVSKKQEQEG